MNSKYLQISFVVVVLAVFCASQAFGAQDELLVEGVSAQPVSAWVQKTYKKAETEERQDGGATTKRPDIGDIIGGGLQSIFQGIVKAPGQIANRVQGIISGILRPPSRSSTPAPKE